MSDARDEYLSDLSKGERLHEDGLDAASMMDILRSTEPIKTDDNWCFECDMPIDECTCYGEGE